MAGFADTFQHQEADNNANNAYALYDLESDEGLTHWFNPHAFLNYDFFCSPPEDWPTPVENAGSEYIPPSTDGGMQGDWGYLYQGGPSALDGNFCQPPHYTPENHLGPRSETSQDLVLSMTQVWDRTSRPATSSAQVKAMPHSHHSSEDLSPSSSATLPQCDSETGVKNSDTLDQTLLGNWMSIAPELKSCRLCPYKGSAQRIKYVWSLFLGSILNN